MRFYLAKYIKHDKKSIDTWGRTCYYQDVKERTKEQICLT